MIVSIALYKLISDGGGSGNSGSTLPVGSEVKIYCGLLILEELAIAVATQISSDTY